MVEQVEQLDEETLSALPALLAQLSTSAVFDGDHLAAVVAHPASTLLVARVRGQVVGTTTLVTYPIPTGWRAHVDDVVVSAEARGRGAGEALVRAAVQRALDRGVRTIELTSRPSRESAIRLYERLGFTRRETGVYRYDTASVSRDGR